MSADRRSAPNLLSKKTPLVSPFSLRASAITFAAVLAIQLVLFWPMLQDRRSDFYQDLEQSVDLEIAKIVRNTDAAAGLEFAQQVLELRDVIGVELTNSTVGTTTILGAAETTADTTDGGQHPFGERSYWHATPGELTPPGLSLRTHLTTETVQARALSFSLNYLAVSLVIIAFLTALTALVIEKYVLAPLMTLKSALSAPEGATMSELQDSARDRSDEFGDVFRTAVELLKQNAEFRDNMGQLVLERTLELTSV